MECPKCGAFMVESNPKCWNCGYQEQKPSPPPFYTKTWFTWITLLLVYPVGVLLLWKFKKHNLLLRVILTGLILILIPIYQIAVTSGQFIGDWLASYSGGVYSQEASDLETERKIQFKNIMMEDDYGLGNVQGEVINHDNKVHSFDMSIDFFDRNRRLICTASGTVLDLQPDSSKTFQATALQYPGITVYQRVRIDGFLK